MNGYHLSDNENNLTKWAFPDTTIGAGEYLIVWADNDTLQAGLHANFVLSSLGESLFLSDNFGFVLDEVIFPAQLDNITWGRYGNGLGSFMYLYPTFAWTNTTPVGLEEQAMESLTVYPNPSSGITTIQFSGIVETTLRITDMTGHVVFEDRIINSDSYNFDASAYKAGMYFIITDTGNVIKFVKN